MKLSEKISYEEIEKLRPETIEEELNYFLEEYNIPYETEDCVTEPRKEFYAKSRAEDYTINRKLVVSRVYFEKELEFTIDSLLKKYAELPI